MRNQSFGVTRNVLCLLKLCGSQWPFKVFAKLAEFGSICPLVCPGSLFTDFSPASEVIRGQIHPKTRPAVKGGEVKLLQLTKDSHWKRSK